MSLQNVDVILLCGGKGSRLQSVVHDRPKPLALIDGKPFLDLLIDALFDAGCSRIILSIGYLREQIRTRYEASRVAMLM
jgi:D-glycero-alpha-D-manno-heptose 1-phosphate guanylyltransferase